MAFLVSGPPFYFLIHLFAFSRDTFVEEKLVLYLGYGGAFDGGGVGDDVCFCG